MCEIGMHRKSQMRGRVAFVYKKSSLGILLEHKQEASVHVSSSAIRRICRPNCIASSTMHKTKQWSLLRLKIPHLVGYPHRPSHGNGVGCAVADNVLITGLTFYLESLGWNWFSCISVSVAYYCMVVSVNHQRISTVCWTLSQPHFLQPPSTWIVISVSTTSKPLASFSMFPSCWIWTTQLPAVENHVANGLPQVQHPWPRWQLCRHQSHARCTMIDDYDWMDMDTTIILWL